VGRGEVPGVSSVPRHMLSFVSTGMEPAIDTTTYRSFSGGREGTTTIG